MTGSTDSHYPGSQSNSSQVPGSGSSRRNPTSDIIHILANPGSSPINSTGLPFPGLLPNTDDAPTVITQNRPSLPIPITQTINNASDSHSIANRRLGHFELIEAIGAGGMAAVLKARDLELGRIVALKILPPEAARDPECVTRFKQEARAAAMLDHDNVARVYFCGEDQGLHFIAFEFVEGENLRTLIERRGTISPADCIRYMIQVAAGLNHAGERGVVHRDIKPSNIIITPDGRAKIVDMGLARHLNSLAVNGGVTQSGVTLGTFDYISPEQALDPRQADVRSDIYSLGCTFYHALTGRPPVPEGTAAKKLQAHQQIDPLDPRLLNPAIPDGLAAILSRMMAKRSADRYQTPTELIAHLKGLMEQLKIGSETVPSDSVIQSVAPNTAVLPGAPRLRLSWLLAGASVAAAIAVFMMSTGESGSPTSPPSWVTDSGGRKLETATSSPLPVPSSTNQSVDDFIPTVETVQQLAEALTNPSIRKVLLARGVFNLDDPCLAQAAVTENVELELIGSSTDSTIFRGATPHSGLTIKSKTVTIRNIRFERSDESFADAESEIARATPLLSLPATNTLRLSDCFFHGPLSAGHSEEAVAVAVSGRESQPVHMAINRCGFARVTTAIQAPARAEVLIADCGIEAQTAAVQIVGAREESGEGTSTAAKVVLSRSSFMVDPRAAVVATGTPVDVKAGWCVFAALGQPQDATPASPAGTVLAVSQPAPGDGLKVAYSYEELSNPKAGITSQKNAYYRVQPLLITTGETQKLLSFEECKASMLAVEDKRAEILSQRPWADADPVASFASAEKCWSAFGLKIATEPAVFTNGGVDSPTVIGVQFHDSLLGTRERGRAYPKSVATVWPPAKPRSNEVARKVWYPDLKAGEPAPPGTSSNLQELLRQAKPDEEIFIRHDGLLYFPETIELKSRTGTLTFKPAEGSRPILTTPHPPAPGQGVIRDQFLFRLTGGDVAFEGLQFLLKPSLPRESIKVAAVTIGSGRSCSFTDCVFSLAEEDELTAPVAVVMVEDPNKVMVMADGGNRPVPDVTFKHCTIRGRGRGICIQDSRAVKVEMNQTLTAIYGPLIRAESSGKMLAGARSSLKLNHVTAFVGGPIMDLHGVKAMEMRANGLVPFDVHAEDCLFAAVPGAGSQLVELDVVDDADAKSVLNWQPGKNANHYANFDDAATVMILRPTGDAVPKEVDWNNWITFAHESGGRPVGKVQFAKPPTKPEELAAIKPEDAQIKELKFPDLSDANPSFDDIGASPRSLPVPWPSGSAGDELKTERRPE